MTEINGFQIDTFNRFDLKVGASASICPLCSHTRSTPNQKQKCASLDWERGIGTCHHCSETFQLHTFKRKTDKVYIKPKQKINDLHRSIRDYFSNRHITSSTLQRAKVTGTDKEIHFNYYANGELINIKYRGRGKKFRIEKGAELIWYNFDALLYNDNIVVVEGEIDALSFMEAGISNVVSVPNGASNFSFIDSSIDLFENIQKIYLCVDNDEAGQKLSQELIRRLGAEKIFLVDLAEAKDANEYLAIHGVDALAATITNAVQLPLDGINTIGDVSNEIDEFFRTGGPSGFKCGIDSLDDIFTVLPKQYCVVTAVPTAGKTFFVDQYAIGMNKNHGWKVAMCSVESKPDWIAGSNLVRKMYGEFPQEIDTQSNKYKKIKDHLNDNFFFIDLDSYNLDAVLNKATELVKRKGIKMLVLDPINRIRGKEKNSIGEYTIEYFSKIDEWCKKYDTFAMVVAHPHKIQKLENGEWPEMSYYNIAGGADIANMAYHILALHRSAITDDTTIKVLKCKFNFLGKNGASATFKYDIKTTNFEAIRHAKEEEPPWYLDA